MQATRMVSFGLERPLFGMATEAAVPIKKCLRFISNIVRGVRTRACRVETLLDAWASRRSKNGVEMSLDAARTSAYATLPRRANQRHAVPRQRKLHASFTILGRDPPGRFQQLQLTG